MITYNSPAGWVALAGLLVLLAVVLVAGRRSTRLVPSRRQMDRALPRQEWDNATLTALRPPPMPTADVPALSMWMHQTLTEPRPLPDIHPTFWCQRAGCRELAAWEVPTRLGSKRLCEKDAARRMRRPTRKAVR